MNACDPAEALAARFDVPAEVVRRVAELGLLPREPDASLGGAAARRVSLQAFALSRGIPQEHLLAAMESYGDLFVSFDAMGLTPADTDRATVLAEVGIDKDLAEQLMAAAGISAAAPPSFEDLAALRSAKEALEFGLPLPVLLQLLRVFADNMEATAEVSTGLLRLVEPTVLYFHRRAWAVASQHDFIRHLTEDSRPLPSSPGAAPCAVMWSRRPARLVRARTRFPGAARRCARR